MVSLRTRPADISYLVKSASVYGFAPARAVSDLLGCFYGSPFSQVFRTGRFCFAANEMFERSSRDYVKKSFGFGAETAICRRPFCNLIRFDDSRVGAQKLLIVAPLSGHFATLLRGTIEPLLLDFEVYITDWINARDVPLGDGEFSLETYIEYLREFIRELGPDVNVLAVCQPGVPVLAALSLMEMDRDPCVPRGAVLMGSPIDTSRSPTAVNITARARGLDWFEENCIARVPFAYNGAGRNVYPGFLQLFGFMAMNLDKHIEAHLNLFGDLYRGDVQSADKRKAFYDEYLTVMDLPAEFYLETVKRIFIDNQLAEKSFTHRGRLVDASAIERVSIMAIEGEKDDITGLGQTRAALDLASNLPASKKHYHMQEGVGHYGLFSGTTYRTKIAPRVKTFFNDLAKPNNVAA